jgi:hypothetical protein
VLDHGLRLEFAFADLLRYAGPHSPVGVAQAFKVLERALPLLAGGEVPQRRAIAVRTAFGGPGARDGFECVLRAVTGDRYTVDPALARPELGTRARFVFELEHAARRVTLVLRDGFVTDEFLALAGREHRDDAEERRLTELKAQLAQRTVAAPASAVYDVERVA